MNKKTTSTSRPIQFIPETNSINTPKDTDVAQEQGTAPQAKSTLSQTTTTTTPAPVEERSITRTTEYNPLDQILLFPIILNHILTKYKVNYNGQLLVELRISDINDILNSKFNEKFELLKKYNLKCSLYIECRNDLTNHDAWINFFINHIANIAQICFDETNFYNSGRVSKFLEKLSSKLITLPISIHINQTINNSYLDIPPMPGINSLSCNNHYGAIYIKTLKDLTHLQFKILSKTKCFLQERIDQKSTIGIEKFTITASNNLELQVSLDKNTTCQSNLETLYTLNAKSTGPLKLRGRFNSIEIINLFEIEESESASLDISSSNFPKLKELHIRSNCKIIINSEYLTYTFPALEIFTYPPELEDDPGVKLIKQEIKKRKQV